MDDPSKTAAEPDLPKGEAKLYWRDNLRLIAVLLAVWFSVSVLGSIVFVETLNKVTIGSIPLGFWLGQQGSIITFVVLIGIYVLAMDRIDRKHGIGRD